MRKKYKDLKNELKTKLKDLDNEKTVVVVYQHKRLDITKSKVTLHEKNEDVCERKEVFLDSNPEKTKTEMGFEVNVMKEALLFINKLV